MFLALKASKAYQVRLVPQAQLVPKDFKVRLVRQATMEQLVHRERQALQACQVRLV
jgi:hypothetical protein